MKTIFISSPYTNGDTEFNLLQQKLAMHTLMDRGYAPFAPTLAHYADLVNPRPYEEWMAFCLAWVARCDALVRLKDDVHSPGADREVAEAKRLSIPVFHGIDDVPHALQAKVD